MITDPRISINRPLRSVSLLLPVIILFLLSCSTAMSREPDWIGTGKLKGFDSDRYLTAVGTGVSLEKAVADAQAAIASQISVTVESEVSHALSEKAVGSVSEYSEDFTRLTKTSVGETMEGIEIIRQQKAGDMVYVFAVLDKRKYTGKVRADLADLADKADVYMNDARDALKNGRFRTAFSSFRDANETVLKYETQRAALSSVFYSPDQQIPVLNSAEVLSEVRRALSSFSLIVESGNGQSASPGTYLAQPFVVKAVYRSADGSFPLADLPLDLRDVENTLLERSATDSEGRAVFFVPAFPDANGRAGHATVQINAGSISSSFRTFLSRNSLRLDYTVSKISSIETSLAVRASDGSPLEPAVAKKLTSALNGLSVSVSEDAPFFLRGTLTKGEEKAVDGARGSQTLVKAVLFLELGLKESGKVFSSAEFTATGLSAKSSRDAYREAQKKFSFSKNSLSRLLSDAGDQLEKALNTRDRQLFDAGRSFLNEGRTEDALRYLRSIRHDPELIRQGHSLIQQILNPEDEVGTDPDLPPRE